MTVAIMCGGASYEHEVSIISGIQIAQHIDRSLYQPYMVYFDKSDQTFLIKDFKHKSDFKTKKRIPVDLVRTPGGGLTIKSRGLLGGSISIDLCFLSFHGGTGESGPVQGLLEFLNAAYTGASQESAVIVMNKAITKEVLHTAEIPVLPWVSLSSIDYLQDKQQVLAAIKKKLNLPLIIKPVHLGSSIGITIVHDDVELEQQLSVAAHTDTEVLVEPALSEFTEYNVAVRSNQGEVELSPIEEPIRVGEVLSFEDKYANGSKKGGGKVAGGGMELLDRTVPAEISDNLENDINALAKRIYSACRLTGSLRIDFMYSSGKLYCTEVNPIPGSHAFYLWEAGGQSFTEQITTDIEDALVRRKDKITIEPYETDIIDKFIGA